MPLELRPKKPEKNQITEDVKYICMPQRPEESLREIFEDGDQPIREVTIPEADIFVSGDDGAGCEE